MTVAKNKQAKKKQSRTVILNARNDFGLTDAEFSRLLVNDGRGGRGTYDKWVLNESDTGLQGASQPVFRHIESLQFLKENYPAAFEEIIKKIKK